MSASLGIHQKLSNEKAPFQIFPVHLIPTTRIMQPFPSYEKKHDGTVKYVWYWRKIYGIELWPNFSKIIYEIHLHSSNYDHSTSSTRNIIVQKQNLTIQIGKPFRLIKGGDFDNIALMGCILDVMHPFCYAFIMWLIYAMAYLISGIFNTWHVHYTCCIHGALIIQGWLQEWFWGKLTLIDAFRQR